MNKKSRLLLPTIGLVVLSGIAATSTTFAWFTTVRSATVTMDKAKVVSTDSNLLIEHAHTWNTTLSNSSSVDGGTGVKTLSYAAATGTEITDISGDGKTFYKPLWATAPTLATRIDNVTPVAAGSADGFLVDFTIKVSRDAGNTLKGIRVYLGAGTKFEPIAAAAGEQLDKDNEAIAGARMSVYTADAGGVLGTKKFIYAPVAEVGGYKYIVADAGKTTYGVSGYDVVTDANVKTDAFSTATTNDAATYEIAYLAGSEAAGSEVESAYVNFRFWVEGEDSDTVSSMISGEFKVTLDLYALPYDA